MTVQDTELGGPLKAKGGVEPVAPGVYSVGVQGNGFAVETGRGLLLVDTGASRARVPEVLAALREHTGAPLRWIVYSHGHLGYNYGVPAFLEDAERRGDPRPTIVAHANVVRRYRRYIETAGLQNHINAMQFRRPKDALPPVPPLTFPDATYTGTLTLHAGRDRTVRLIEAPSETDDATAVWLPDERILYAGAAVIDSIPNIGTPLRTLRDAVRWADTLDRLAALDPAVLVPEFGPVRREGIGRVLTGTAAALRWLRAETVERLNRGMSAVEILHDLEYPAELFDVPWMRETYGHREFIVRDIVRSETGWWDGNPTSLHPAPPDAAAAAVADAVADKAAVLAKARELRDAGRVQEALHVVDVLALAPDGPPDAAPEIAEARSLKAELCALRAAEVTSYVSRSLYRRA
ncbi:MULTISPECIES: alkyl sulfatase dimerization domain-containing protein [Actinomadura]|uniref:Alkyl sulfatase dimerization domain-containing protein n=1 Tax=Actinomadura yumaensis TaxID=111807 RepID=A0ABW2CAT6_9ACTN|nr:alkyl sulfatase dimerization domain-containing protein [Actinomadura sp. J1-007]MWK33405.1 MBL fold metallo-hydrolase [Actinomadura sp. J1-007]